MTIVRVTDFRRVGICPDAKAWFDKNGLDWRQFVLQGVSADTLLAVNADQKDNIAAVIKAAEERENCNG